MMKKSSTSIYSALPDASVVGAICAGLRQMRLNRNLSQQELALRAGLNRATIVRMEAGRAATLLTVVQVLRVLDNLDILQVFAELPPVSPMALLRQQQQQQKAQRRRASSKTKTE